MAVAYSRSIIDASNLGAAICESLGLNPKNVRAFTLQFHVGELPMLAVEFITPEGSSEAMVRAFRQFNLIPKEG